MTDTGFFRPEALQAVSSAMGKPVAIKHLSNWTVLAFFLSLFLAACVFIITTQYTRKETVAGYLTPIEGVAKISSTRNGIASQVYVKEGQLVRKGQLLIAISSSSNLSQGVSVANGLEQNYQQQKQAQQEETKARLEQIHNQRDEQKARQQGLETDLLALNQNLQLQQQKLQMQEQTLQALHKLGEQGIVATLTIRNKEEDFIVAKQSLLAIQREIEQKRNSLQQLRAQFDKLNSDERLLQSENQRIKAQFAEKAMNTEANYGEHLTAAADGMVTALQTKVGNQVFANQTLAIILPEKNQPQAGLLEAELWAPSKAIGFVKTGNKVRLMFDSFPYQNFGVINGVVQDIALAPSLPNEISNINTKEPLFRLRVRLAKNSLSAFGKDWALTPGMAVSADLVLEERSLLDWLFEPLIAISKRGG